MTLEEAKAQFSKQFWDAMDKNRGGVPFLRRMNEDLDLAKTKTMSEDNNDSAANPTKKTSSSATDTGAGTTPSTPTAAPPAPAYETATTTTVGEGGEGTQKQKQKQHQQQLSFWQRCTLIGLVIGLWMGWWGLSTVHWPTVVWVSQRPHALALR